ncbi:hypothetical protein LINPERHAP2_LOCUS27060 [Linum perenne]
MLCSSIPIVSINGCGNKGHVPFVNSGWDQLGKIPGEATLMVRTTFRLSAARLYTSKVDDNARLGIFAVSASLPVLLIVEMLIPSYNDLLLVSVN